MSRSLNKVMLIGFAGGDPEVRTIPSGARTAQFSLATSQRWNDRSGQPQERTEWHRIVVWEKTVDFVEKYVRKGDKLYIEGEIQYRQYQDKDGVTKYSTEIRAREVLLLGSKDGEQRKPAQQQAQRGGDPYADFKAPTLDDEIDDVFGPLPF